MENFKLPIGVLSESALEARKKYNRMAREFHARKTSMNDIMFRMFFIACCAQVIPICS
jgi:hypothetical protein